MPPVAPGAPDPLRPPLPPLPAPVPEPPAAPPAPFRWSRRKKRCRHHRPHPRHRRRRQPPAGARRSSGPRSRRRSRVASARTSEEPAPPPPPPSVRALQAGPPSPPSKAPPAAGAAQDLGAPGPANSRRPHLHPQASHPHPPTACRLPWCPDRPCHRSSRRRSWQPPGSPSPPTATTSDAAHSRREGEVVLAALSRVGALVVPPRSNRPRDPHGPDGPAARADTARAKNHKTSPAPTQTPRRPLATPLILALRMTQAELLICPLLVRSALGRNQRETSGAKT